MTKCRKTNQIAQAYQLALYEVEKIVAKRINKAGFQEYQIRWKGYSSKDDTWEPRQNLKVARNFIDQFDIRWSNTISKQNSTKFKQQVYHGKKSEIKQKLQVKQKLNKPVKQSEMSSIKNDKKPNKSSSPQKKDVYKKAPRKQSQNSQETYTVEQIVGKKFDQFNRQLYYKVRWAGYSPNQDTWEPFQNLSNAKKLVQLYQKKTKKIKKDKVPVKKQYQVLRIVGKRQTKEYGLEYKVRWRGYKPCEDTWQPARNLYKVKLLINNYENEQKTKQQVVKQPITQIRAHQIQPLAQAIVQSDNYQIGGADIQQQLNSEGYSYVSSISVSQNVQRKQDVQGQEVGAEGQDQNKEINNNINEVEVEVVDWPQIYDQDNDIIDLNFSFDKERFQKLYW